MTNKTKHTPGPWNLSSVTDSGLLYKEGHYEPIGGCGCCGSPFMTADGAEAKANARLIASAPELLEALENAVKFIKTMVDETGYGQPLADELDLLIAKARGQS